MSIFSRRSRKNKGTRPPSPLMIEVMEINSKVDALLAMRPSAGQQQQQQAAATSATNHTQTQHEQGFEPFSDFEPMQGEASSNGE